MTDALLALTALEIAVFVGALVFYLVRIAQSLRVTTDMLAKVTFGVRAIESQCRPIGPTVVTLNAQLDQVVAELDHVGELAEHAARGA